MYLTTLYGFELLFDLSNQHELIELVLIYLSKYKKALPLNNCFLFIFLIECVIFLYQVLVLKIRRIILNQVFFFYFIN